MFVCGISMFIEQRPLIVSGLSHLSVVVPSNTHNGSLTLRIKISKTLSPLALHPFVPGLSILGNIHKQKESSMATCFLIAIFHILFPYNYFFFWNHVCRYESRVADVLVIERTLHELF